MLWFAGSAQLSERTVGSHPSPVITVYPHYFVCFQDDDEPNVPYLRAKDAAT